MMTIEPGERLKAAVIIIGGWSAVALVIWLLHEVWSRFDWTVLS